jgi:DNA-binding GntR family transcriptional regulator
VPSARQIVVDWDVAQAMVTPATCPDLPVADRIEQGTSSYIEAQTGRVAATGHAQFTAGAAGEVATVLGIVPGTTVPLARNRWVDEQGRVIEYGESVCPRAGGPSASTRSGPSRREAGARRRAP